MLEAHELEEIVITIRNKSTRTSACVMDECFAEHIEQRMQKLPINSRDAFMRIAIEHGYKSARERQLNYAHEAEGFDGDFYDDLFPLNEDQWH